MSVDRGSPLPIDPLLPSIAAAVAAHPLVLLEAEPGAGKTTRVPAALLASYRSIWVTEPRRLAARLAAGFVAKERGEPVGETIGYAVRFDDRRSAKTRVVYATEGVLARRLQSDPDLLDVDVVILDEFHERHVDTDLCFALVRQLQTRRPALRLVLMSATLGAEGLTARFPEAPFISAPGRTFPVDIEYLPEGSPDRPLESEVAAAVRRALSTGPATDDGGGDILVFLPGLAEIRRAERALAETARTLSLDVRILHGDLAPEEQDRVVRRGERRRVILSTNLAESSVTIDGVRTVIDSGLYRQASHSPISGLPQLRTARIARSSAIQRAGRAGRQAPGRCFRLYPKSDFLARPEDSKPEIERDELSDLALACHLLGYAPSRLSFPTPPPRAALEVANQLLLQLGAITKDADAPSRDADRDGAPPRITPLGRQIARRPLPVRLARLLVACDDAGLGSYGALLATLLAEGHGGSPDRPGEMVDEVVLFVQQNEIKRQRAIGEAWRRLAATTTTPPTAAQELALRRCLLVAFADRAGQVTPSGREVQLASGQRLAIGTPITAPYILALDGEERRTDGRTQLRLLAYCAIEPDWLLDQPLCEMVSTIEWIDNGQRFESTETMKYGALTLDSERRRFPRGQAPPAISERLAARLEAKPQLVFDADQVDHFERLRRRVAVAFADASPDLPAPSLTMAALLAVACPGASSLEEVKQVDLLAIWEAMLPSDIRRRLEAFAPDRMRLHAGRTVKIEYPDGSDPFVASRLQDFFGQDEVPLVGGKPILVHLLAPNQRAVQVTRDLASFWRNQYAELRNQLSRRYPRHDWPDDPASAVPTPPRPRRR